MTLEPWQSSVIESLAALSNAALQRRAWVERADVPFSISPGELVNELFDDTGLTELLPAGPVFSAKADGLLVELSELLDGLDLRLDPEVVLSDPGWRKAQQLAAATLDELELVLQNR